MHHVFMYTLKGVRPFCNLFTPKVKGELKEVTLVSKPVWEVIVCPPTRLLLCCWNGAPGILNALGALGWLFQLLIRVTASSAEPVRGERFFCLI